MCPHTAVYVSSYLYMCPQTSICVFKPLYMSAYLCVLIPTYVSQYLSMCPPTSTYVSSYLYICVLIPLYLYIHVPSYLYMCLNTSICVLIPLPLHMCPQVDEVLSSGSVTRLIVTPRQGTRYQHAAYVQVCLCVLSVFRAFIWRVSSVFLFVSTWLPTLTNARHLSTFFIIMIFDIFFKKFQK